MQRVRSACLSCWRIGSAAARAPATRHVAPQVVMLAEALGYVRAAGNCMHRVNPYFQPTDVLVFTHRFHSGAPMLPRGELAGPARARSMLLGAPTKGSLVHRQAYTNVCFLYKRSVGGLDRTTGNRCEGTESTLPNYGLVFSSRILGSSLGCRDIGIKHVHLLILKLNGRRARSVPVRYKTKLVSCHDLKIPWPNMFRSQ